jgi:hypothetical protein
MNKLLNREARTALYQAFDTWLEDQEIEERDRAFYLVQSAGLYHALWCANNGHDAAYFEQGVDILIRAFKAAATKVYEAHA